MSQQFYLNEKRKFVKLLRFINCFDSKKQV